MEEEVVCCGLESGGGLEVREEGPEGLDGGKGGYLLDTTFIIDGLARCTLLPEPKHPSI